MNRGGLFDDIMLTGDINHDAVDHRAVLTPLTLTEDTVMS